MTRTCIDVPARTVRLYGPRPLRGTDGGLLPDATTITTLSRQVVRLHTADGDAVLTVTDAAGRLQWRRSAQGTVNHFDYEPPGTAGRPLLITEAGIGATTRVRERFAYGDPACAQVRACNLAGAVTRHYDNAGYTDSLSVSLTGQALLTKRYLLCPAAAPVDWMDYHLVATEHPLVLGAAHDATGNILAQTNAAGVTILSLYDVSGAVRQTRLRNAQQAAQPQTEVITLQAVWRRADGRVLSQIAGNGITDVCEYDPRTLRLTRRLIQRPASHQLGAMLIADLHYTYDPAGNILRLEEKGAATFWYQNRRADGVRHYVYDTLYRLTSTTGRERCPVARRQGPYPALLTDATAGSVWTPYVERYSCDDGNNLTESVHIGQRRWTRRAAVSVSSNRAVIVPSGKKPGEIKADEHFLAGGRQKCLADGRQLHWHADGQLRRVSPVAREGGGDDTETYYYADPGTRVRKVHRVNARGGWRTTVTTSAGGCETRQRMLCGDAAPQLHVIITEAEGVRLVENRLTGEMHLRYSFSDHLGSVSAETDGEGRLTSREEYLPYGGRAGSDEEASEIMDRTRRYSGKEQDATGLYYYGWRYYQPEGGRWLSADPGGLIDGVNLFRFCRNNPINGADLDGREPTFSELFKAERGDLFFGLGNVIGGYRTWWGMISFRMDYMNLVISPNQAQLVPQGIYKNIQKLYEGSAEEKKSIINGIKNQALESIADNTNSTPWWVFIQFPESGKNAQIRQKIISHIDRDDYRYALHRTIIESTKELFEQAERLTTDNADQIRKIESQWMLDTGKKVITRTSKAALDMIIKSRGDEKIHFILDGINMDKVIKKQEAGMAYSQRSTTAAELRFLYRNKQQLTNKVLFYKNRVRVAAPWESDPDRWRAYKPQSSSMTTPHASLKMN